MRQRERERQKDRERDRKRVREKDKTQRGRYEDESCNAIIKGKVCVQSSPGGSAG